MLLFSSFFIVGVLAEETNSEEEPNGHGIVMDAVTGEPLHALLFLVNPEMDIVFTAETGEDGIFKLHLPVGGYVWEAEAENYNPGRGEFEVTERGWGIKIVLKPIEDPGIPEFNIVGMLVDATTGQGVFGHVGFINPDGLATEMDTKENGEFTILLPPGQWGWKAGARGYETREGRLLMERETIHLMIELIPLEQEEPEIRGAVLYGQVATPEGKPIPGALVMLHPMFREDPPPEPRIPEDPNVGSKETDRLTASGEIPEEESTRVENDLPAGITLRQLVARLSERFDEATLKRVFTAADADADGVLNERELLRARTLLREISSEETPERIPLHAETNEKGVFKIRVPFGQYMIITEARGFHPNEMPIRISPRQQEHKVRIVLEPMREPEREGRRMKIVFNMVDENSDGDPEVIKFAADLNGDGVHEIVYHMVDRNSDGDPESVEWALDIPLEMCEKVKSIIMRLIEGREGYNDIDWDQWAQIKEEWEGYEGGEEAPMDLEYFLDLITKRTSDDPDAATYEETDPSLIDEEEIEDSDDLDDGEMDLDGVSDKKSSNSEESPVLEVLAAVGVLSFILAILIGFGFYIRKTRH
jgi:hypothetical protein